MEWVTYVPWILALAAFLLLGIVLRRIVGRQPQDNSTALEALRTTLDQMEARLQAEAHRLRMGASTEARGTREELAVVLKHSGDSIVRSVAAISEAQRTQLAELTSQLARLRTEVTGTLHGFNDSLTVALGQTSQAQTAQLDGVLTKLQAVLEHNEQRLQAVQGTVDARLRELREENTQQLERMRLTVDEKLHQTLEQRLGETFRLVSDRLDAVHKGLGEMQSLATGVGDLKRVLTNVKTRGTWGEIQLGNLLEQILTTEQYQANVATRPNTGERVEFAIRLPGRGNTPDETVWLPIDAKFPQEDYQRLLDAQEQGLSDTVTEARKRFEAQVRNCAKQIADKYLNPPHTTDFGIMYLPTEGLYAEVVRQPGLLEALQRHQRIVVAGPTTLAALLNSLQMGFRTLAVERRSSEVWALLGAVKTEFQKFGAVLDRVQLRLNEASDSLDKASRQTRTIEKKLKKVQELPANMVPERLDATDESDPAGTANPTPTNSRETH